MNWLLLAIAVISETIGTTALKASDGFTKLWPSLLVIGAYGISFSMLSIVLRTIPVGVAYAIWSGAGIFLISVIGWFWFNQRLDTPAVLGIGMILAGILVINLFSNTTTH